MARKSHKTVKRQKFDPFSPSTFLMVIIMHIVFILFLVGQFFLYIPYDANEYADKSDAEVKFEAYDFRFVRIGSETYKLYISDDELKRNQGLSDVTSMYDYEGMAFVFETSEAPAFWMKDMNFSLDFVYLQDGVIVDIVEDVSPESYPDLIYPSSPATIVIELNDDQIELNEAQIGDQVEL